MENKGKDFFISYAKSDKQWAMWIDSVLREAGYSTFAQVYNFRSGGSYMDDMDRALMKSKRLIIVFSAQYLNNLYCQAEWQNVFAGDATEEKARIIPVLIEKVQPKSLPAAQTYIDLAEKREEEAKQELLGGLSLNKHLKNRPSFSSIRKMPFPGNLPFNNLPDRNPYFTGREELLATMYQTFKRGDAIALTQSFTGLGGVGKSQAAIEYAFRYACEYKTAIWWVNAETTDTLLSSYATFATAYELSEPTDTSEQIIEAVRNWMNQHDNWLFIFDNATDAATLVHYLATQHAGRRHVLITSPYRDWKSLAALLTVDVFSKEEACNFLTKRTGIPNDEFQDKLAEQLGYLPLALELAAACICNNAGYNYRKYLLQLQKYNPDAVKASPDEVIKQSIHATWNISIGKIGNKTAIRMLNLCAFFAPDRIDLSWFMKVYNLFILLFRIMFTNQLHFHKAGAVLARYSLVEIREEKLYIHPLLQEVIRDSLKTEQKTWLNHCIRILNKCRYLNFSTPAKRTLFTELVPHIRYVVAQIPEEDIQTKKNAHLYFFLGYIYNEFADYTQALEWYRKAIAIREQILAPFHPMRAITYNRIATVYNKQGDYEKALEWYLKAIPFHEKMMASHPSTAILYNDIAAVYFHQGEKEKALEWYMKALPVIEKLVGARHSSTAATYNNIAEIYMAQDNYEKALEWIRKSFDISEKILGMSHPDMAITCGNMALVYNNKGDYENALEWFLKASSIREETLGLSHPDTATVYHNIALVYTNRHNNEKALAWYMKAGAIREKVLGASHPDTIATYTDIATEYYILGNNENAVRWYRKVLAVNGDTLDASPPAMDTDDNNTAELRDNQSAKEKVQEWYAKVLPVFIEVLGLNHPDTETIMNNVKKNYKNSGNTKPFEEWLKEKYRYKRERKQTDR